MESFSNVLRFYFGAVETFRLAASGVICTQGLYPRQADLIDVGGVGIEFRRLYLSSDAYIGGKTRTNTIVALSGTEIGVESDLLLSDDKFLKVGRDSDGSLPAPSATYRGRMIRVEGASGVADKLYICMKNTDDSYSWIEVASGT